ncbi:MAG: hypothetical protein R3B47_09875 [Bacteroidia bacterium]
MGKIKTGFLQGKKTGTIRISPLTDWELSQIRVSLVYELKGKLGSEKYVVDQSTLLNGDTSLNGGQEYSFDFELQQHNPGESWDGKNVSIVFSIEVDVFFNKDPQTEDFLDKLSRFISGEKKISKVKFINAANPAGFMVSGDYDSSMALSINNKLALILVLGIALLIAVIAINALPGPSKDDVWWWIVVGLMFSIIGGLGLQYLILRSLVGRFRMLIQPADESRFFCTIESEKGWKSVREAYCYYYVYEKVVDRRGTSDTTYREVIYRCPEQKLEQDHFGETKVTLAYPDRHIPDIRINDVSIEWQMVLELETSFGMTLTCKGDFSVYRNSAIG